MKKNNIVVQVETSYLPEQSTINQENVFKYTITIVNNGKTSAKLLQRHWMITDNDNQPMEVIGDGVIGQQPLIHPNQEYQYSSFVALESTTGVMSGFYTMQNTDGEFFKAIVPPFFLMINETIY